MLMQNAVVCLNKPIVTCHQSLDKYIVTGSSLFIYLSYLVILVPVNTL